MNKIMIICDSAIRHLGLFRDIENRDDVMIQYREKKKLGPILDTIGKIYCTRRINKIIRLPYRSIWYSKVPNYDISEVKTILVMDGVLECMNTSELKMYKRKGKRVYLYMIDSFDSFSPVLSTVRKIILSNYWDRIYTFDKADSDKYGFIYWGFNYYSKNKEISLSKITNDIYYTGGIKGERYEMIKTLYDFFQRNNVSCNFDIALCGNKEKKSDSRLTYRKHWISYENVLRMVLSSNCILEVMQKNQSGPSLRYFEAVVYNKKLLTNNSNIVNFPFYDSRWMKIFKNIEDIDVDWILKDERIDYKYNNEFSPVHLVEKILTE